MVINSTHLVFDLLAWLGGMVSGVLVYRLRLRQPVTTLASTTGLPYFLSLLAGGILGAWLLGSLNLYLSDIPKAGRSILGAVAGAVFTVELYKWRHGIRQSTGWLFVIPLCVTMAVGRIGCYLAGLDDFTYGTPSALPWAVDFGDGVLRHPVQLYESLSLLVMLAGMIWLLRYRPAQFVTRGFYLWILLYAGQRFVWEFFKPYSTVIVYLNLFHLICLGLILYSILMLKRKDG
ncbi:MAG: prolipoprotein diacylglyceryl transferase [Gammaproteobacteria bacterium]|nr:prolipoprotein diacylglyceryl transferase [Gammaproteobacteria bacterium]MDH5651871.1 prolipoprotein diacylglyceryl transferase [Gammaproteobacteria bacterium]